MANSLTSGCAAIGLDALAHTSFLVRAPERVLALRLALSRVIRPTSAVLDAGCGSLGVFAMLSAKLDAARVIGVDVGALDRAKALAEENGVADRVQFIQCDLHDIDLPIQTFDVIVSMIYNNELQRDRTQQRLVGSLVSRFGHADTVVIPNKVLYTVAGYHAGVRDRSNWTLRIEWEARIQNMERQTGMTLAAMRHLLDQAGATEWIRRFRSQRTLLTPRQVFTEIDYTARRTEFDYPNRRRCR